LFSKKLARSVKANKTDTLTKQTNFDNCCRMKVKKRDKKKLKSEIEKSETGYGKNHL
jgi:hypothetical protein